MINLNPQNIDFGNPVITLDLKKIDFGSIAIGAIVNRNLTIKNFSTIKINVTNITVPDAYTVDWQGGLLFPDESRTIVLQYKAKTVGNVKETLLFDYTVNGTEFQTTADLISFVTDPAYEIQQANSIKIVETEQAEADVSKSTKRAVWTSIVGNSIEYDYYDNGVITTENPSGLPLLRKKIFRVNNVPIYAQVFIYDSMQRVILESCVDPKS